MATPDRSQRPQTVEEFTDNHKRVRDRKWCQCYSTLKGQTRGVLGKRHCLLYGQPLSVDLDHRVSGEEKRRQIGVEPASVMVFNYNVLCQHLGVAPEEGAYS